jgi:hypothetical protein
MRKIVPIAVVVLLLGVPAAIAQTKSGTSGPANPTATPDSRGVPSAPVGHRQPRASEVPSAQENSYTESAEDKALDRKIKSICRGC